MKNASLFRKLSLGIIAFTLFTVPPINAEELKKEDTEEKIIFQKSEINDEKLLLQRAKLGITDNKEMDEKSTTAIQITDENNQTVTPVNTTIYATTEKLKSVTKNNEVVESYVTTIFGIVELEEDNNDINTKKNYTPLDDNGNGELDESKSVYSYSRIYYDLKKYNKISHVGISRVTGYWTLQESKYGLTDTKLRISQAGPSDAVCSGNSMKQTTLYSVKNPFDISTDSKWCPVTVGTISQVEAIMTAKVTDGSEKFDVVFRHSLNK